MQVGSIFFGLAVLYFALAYFHRSQPISRNSYLRIASVFLIIAVAIAAGFW